MLVELSSNTDEISLEFEALACCIAFEVDLLPCLVCPPVDVLGSSFPDEHNSCDPVTKIQK